jgi:hypothetical protein
MPESCVFLPLCYNEAKFILFFLYTGAEHER